VALLHVEGIARAFRFESVRERASTLIDEAAERRGLSREELADRIVPRLDVDVDGRLGKDDKAIVARQIERLEHAMASERVWSARDMTQFVCEHPLMRQLARKLVWCVEVGGARKLVRVCEDRSLEDADDHAVALAPDARVSIVHRLRMTDDEVARWSKIFAEYEIIQPFEQLGRAVHLRREDFGKGVVLAAGRANDLTRHGWSTDGESWVQSLAKAPQPTTNELTVVMTFKPGYEIGSKANAQTIEELELRDKDARVPWSRLGEVAYSELRREVERA
jgi:hypothetical protein